MAGRLLKDAMREVLTSGPFIPGLDAVEGYADIAKQTACEMQARRDYRRQHPQAPLPVIAETARSQRSHRPAKRLIAIIAAPTLTIGKMLLWLCPALIAPLCLARRPRSDSPKITAEHGGDIESSGKRGVA